MDYYKNQLTIFEVIKPNGMIIRYELDLDSQIDRMLRPEILAKENAFLDLEEARTLARALRYEFIESLKARKLDTSELERMKY